MSNARSRSPRHKREYSFSSLSSGSFDNAHTSSYPQRSNKMNRDRHGGNRRKGRASLTRSIRRYSKERRVDSKVPRYDAGIEQNMQKQKDEKRSEEHHYESPEEESYLIPTSHKNHNTRPFTLEKNARHGGQDDNEESMRDPSTCNFRGILQMNEDEVINHEEPVKEERRIHKDETSDRLERLEKLVELLANNNKKLQPIHTNTSQESSWPLKIDALELIPRNTNFTTSMWLNKIQEECIDRNLDEKTSIQFMQSKMTGVVKAWFKTFSSYDFTWPEIKMLITETFPDNIDFAATLRLLIDRSKKPDESITEYYFSKMYLLEACKISGPNAVSCLIDGLENEFWKQEAKSHNFLTPEALYSQFLSKCVDYDYEDQYQEKPEEIEEVRDEVYRYDDSNIEHRGVHEGNKFNNKNRQGFQKKKCLTCKKFGHFTTDCRHAPICYRCKKKGHIAVNCPLILVH